VVRATQTEIEKAVETLRAGDLVVSPSTTDFAVVLPDRGVPNYITGGTGGSTLHGSAANDTLVGGSGADTMAGGTGDDTYIVNNSADSIVELPDAGHDVVQSSVTYTLSANVEALTLTGTANINGTGKCPSSAP